MATVLFLSHLTSEFMYLNIETVSTVVPDFDITIKRVSFRSIASTFDFISMGSVVSKK